MNRDQLETHCGDSGVRLDDGRLRGQEYAHMMFDDPTPREIREWRQYDRELYIANIAIGNWRAV